MMKRLDQMSSATRRMNSQLLRVISLVSDHLRFSLQALSNQMIISGIMFLTMAVFYGTYGREMANSQMFIAFEHLVFIVSPLFSLSA